MPHGHIEQAARCDSRRIVIIALHARCRNRHRKITDGRGGFMVGQNAYKDVTPIIFLLKRGVEQISVNPENSLE